MNELEVINYLKENKTKGVTLAFMPKEVKEYCKDNIFRPDIPFRELTRGGWQKLAYDESFCDEISYCLESFYEPKKSFKSDWQEFDIDDNGLFNYDGHQYYYREDARFETENRNKFKGFGGWLYTGGGRKIWSMTPLISVCDSDIAWSEPDIKGANQNGSMASRSDVTWSEPDIESKPVMPVKIRFWRYRE